MSLKQCENGIQKKHYIYYLPWAGWIFSWLKIIILKAGPLKILLTVQILQGCKNSAFRWQASYPDDAPLRKRFCEFVFAALMTSQKTGATVFLFLFFAWFMHDSWGGCSAHAFVCHSSLTSTDGPQARRSNLTTSWSFILLSNPPAALHRRSNLAACVCVHMCVYTLPWTTSFPCHRAESHSVCFLSADPCMWLTSTVI